MLTPFQDKVQRSEVEGNVNNQMLGVLSGLTTMGPDLRKHLQLKEEAERVCA